MKLLAEISKLLESSQTMYQVRVASDSWQDVDLGAKSLEDIAAAVGADPHDEKAHKGFNVSRLTDLVEGWIGEGPDGRGSSWSFIDYSVASLRDDVLKIEYYFGGFAKEKEVGKSGIITIMPSV